MKSVSKRDTLYFYLRIIDFCPIVHIAFGGEMKTLIISLLCAVLSFLSSPYAIAEVVSGGCEREIDCTVVQGNTTTTTTTNQTNGASPIRRAASGSTTTTTTTTSNYGSVGTEGTGAYAQAETAKNKANGTMLAAYAMAAVLATMCNPPTNVTPCILSPIAAMAGMMAGQKKGDAQRLMDQLGTSGTSTGTDGTADGSITTAGTADNADDNGAGALAKIKADLAKKGYGFNDDGSISTPNGTIAGDLNSQSLQAAGMNADQMSKLSSDLAKLKKDIAEQAENGVAVEEQNIAGSGLDGYGGARTKLFADESETSVAVAGDMERTATDRDPAAWTGYSTKYGDSSIGVPMSDIFLMVEKRVQDERKTMGH